LDVSTLTWHEVGAYAIAAVLYLAHIVGLRRGAENAGRALLAVGVALHFADIGVRCYHGTNPISSTPEAMSLVAFTIAAVYLLTSLRYQLTAAGAFAVPAVVALILLARLAPAEAATPTAVSLHDTGLLGQAHVLLATVGVAVFAFAAVLAIVYLFQDRSLKRKQLERAIQTGTPLETLDRLAHRCVSIGFPLFTLAIVTGAIWVARLGLLHGHGTLRPEYLIAVGTWIAFAVLIIARVGAGWRGRRAAWLTLGGFGGTALVVAAYIIRHAV
jgi:ABC-type uncharacterized transport system permease subunit